MKSLVHSILSAGYLSCYSIPVSDVATKSYGFYKFREIVHNLATLLLVPIDDPISTKDYNLVAIEGSAIYQRILVCKYYVVASGSLDTLFSSKHWI